MATMPAAFQPSKSTAPFTHLPKQKTILHWRDGSSEHFLFSLKASRTITHYKKLKDAAGDLYLFLHLVKPLGKKLGPVLFGLSASQKKDTALLAEFLHALPAHYRFVFEFRHESWFDDKVFELLSRYKVAFCLSDFGQKITPLIYTASFVYIRLHGPKGHYTGKYDAKSLASWAEVIRGFAKEDKEIFCYFNNDEEGFAPQNALELAQLLTL